MWSLELMSLIQPRALVRNVIFNSIMLLIRVGNEISWFSQSQKLIKLAKTINRSGKNIEVEKNTFWKGINSWEFTGQFVGKFSSVPSPTNWIYLSFWTTKSILKPTSVRQKSFNSILVFLERPNLKFNRFSVLSWPQPPKSNFGVILLLLLATVLLCLKIRRTGFYGSSFLTGPLNWGWIWGYCFWWFPL